MKNFKEGKIIKFDEAFEIVMGSANGNRFVIDNFNNEAKTGLPIWPEF
ncbi:hypothetical protein ES703_15994 [subsurface metagenome]